MIVGNKSDLDSERTVEQTLAQSKITELGLTYMEVSAKTGHNIKEFFKELACVIAGGKKTKEEPAPKPVNSNGKTNENRPPPSVAAGNNVSLSNAPADNK